MSSQTQTPGSLPLEPLASLAAKQPSTVSISSKHPCADKRLTKVFVCKQPCTAQLRLNAFAGVQTLVMARASSRGTRQNAVVRVEIVQARNVWHYRPGGTETFYKVTVSMPQLVTNARSASLLLSLGVIHLFSSHHGLQRAV